MKYIAELLQENLLDNTKGGMCAETAEITAANKHLHSLTSHFKFVKTRVEGFGDAYAFLEGSEEVFFIKLKDVKKTNSHTYIVGKGDAAELFGDFVDIDADVIKKCGVLIITGSNDVITTCKVNK